MKWLVAALLCFGGSANALHVEKQAASSGESNTYTSTKTFTSTVQISSAVITYVQASSITTTGGITAYGAVNWRGAENVFSTATFASQSLFTNSYSTAVRISGWSPSGGASSFGGALVLGGSGFDGRITVNGVTGVMDIDNMQDAAGTETNINIRNNGTTLNALKARGDSTITTGGGFVVVHSTLTKTYVGGSAYVCVKDSGAIFASEAACP